MTRFDRLTYREDLPGRPVCVRDLDVTVDSINRQFVISRDIAAILRGMPAVHRDDVVQAVIYSMAIAASSPRRRACQPKSPCASLHVGGVEAATIDYDDDARTTVEPYGPQRSR